MGLLNKQIRLNQLQIGLKKQNVFALAPSKGMRLAGLLNGKLHVAGYNVNSLN